MSKLTKTKKCLKEKLAQATELYEEVKKEAEIVRQVLLNQEVDENAGNAVKRKARISRN